MMRNACRDDQLKRKEKEVGGRDPSSSKRSRNNTALPTDRSILEQITLSPKDPASLIARDDFLTTFQRYQIAYIPNARDLLPLNIKDDKKDALTISDIYSIFQDAAAEDRKTWTQETWVADEKDSKKIEDVPGDFLKDECKDKRGYCSFILQHNKQLHQEVLERLPFADLPVSSSSDSKERTPLPVAYGPGLWIFFGRNDTNGTEALQGRVEHTDSIQHDGTWHYQLSGTKEWHVRPTTELLEQMLEDKGNDKGSDGILSIWKEEQDRGETNDNTRLTIRCQEGDILVVNTRLWWHSTTLPVQTRVSLSYARDMYLNKDAVCSSDNATADPASMTNVDGLYAADDIEAGTIIFRESEMPDCELHRAKENANCEVVELENGEGAIVSSRSIKSGEFFCILESDDDDDDDEEEEMQEADDAD